MLPAHRQVRPRVPRSSQAGTFQAGLCSLSTWHAGRNVVAALLHAAAGACFVFGVCCGVGVQVANVSMYACGAACFECCDVLQRRHNFDAF